MKGKRLGVPTVAFYGEQARWPGTELLHSEKLEERSERHDWHIRAHRHTSLSQLFLLLGGSGTATLDSEDFGVSAPALLIIPEGCVHEFRWQQHSRGFVLSVAAPASGRLQDLSLTMPRVLQPAGEVDYLTTLFEHLHEESTNAWQHRDSVIDSLLNLVCVTASRLQQAPVSPKPRDRASLHFDRFLQLVEQQHKAQWPVSAYADQLGITPAHLNSICRKRSHQSALNIIHSRQLLAARRALTYTEMNVSQVAESLGFDDPAYFTRFFKRLNGMTPREFRRRAGTR